MLGEWVRHTPVDVTTLPDDLVALLLGRWGICGLDASGTATCDDTYFGAPHDPFRTALAAVAVGGIGYCGRSPGGELRCSSAQYPNGLAPLAHHGFGPGCVVGFGDDDGDAICESLDLCANDGVGQDFLPAPKPRFVLRNANDFAPGEVPGDETIELTAKFALPATTTFADLDLLARGATVRLLRPGSAITDVALAPGAFGGAGTSGWLHPNARTWKYFDLSGPPGHRVKLVVLDRGRGLPGGAIGVTLRVDGATASFDEDSGYHPIQAQIVLGDAADGAAGRCGQSAFWSLLCGFRGSAIFKCLTE